MQNTSTAVMQRRHEALDSLDHFPTPPWGTRALCEHVLGGEDLGAMTCWEPACGEGYMARTLREYFQTVGASDCHDHGGNILHDFLMPGPCAWDGTDWIITNPPFRLAAEFVQQALDRCDVGCAMLCRTAFLEGKERHRTLFEPTPPAIVAVFTERLPIVKGRVDRDAQSATSYAWFVWLKHRDTAPRIRWIPPCRKQLEREGDYA